MRSGVGKDLLEPTFSAESLRYALLLAPVATVVGVVFYFRAARTLRTYIERAERSG